MKININISKETCDELLNRYNYTSETVRLYYNIYDDYEVEPDDDHLRAVESSIAYPDGERPAVLDKAHPMVDELDDYMYDRVIERLFNKRLFEVMFGPAPKHIDPYRIKYN